MIRDLNYILEKNKNIYEVNKPFPHIRLENLFPNYNANLLFCDLTGSDGPEEFLWLKNQKICKKDIFAISIFFYIYLIILHN